MVCMFNQTKKKPMANKKVRSTNYSLRVTYYRLFEKQKMVN